LAAALFSRMNRSLAEAEGKQKAITKESLSE
jgi:hypothetical protein